MTMTTKHTDLIRRLREPKITHHQVNRECEPYDTVAKVHPIDPLRKEAADALEALTANQLGGPGLDPAKVIAAMNAAIAPVADDALPEPVALGIHYPEGFPEKVYGYTAEQMRAAIARERAKADAYKHLVIVVEAHEVQAINDVLIDGVSIGPQNLMRRLEEGIPSEYGYTAGAFYALRQQVAEAAQNERERIARMLDAEHAKRKHADNHAAFYARMIRESAIAAGAQK